MNISEWGKGALVAAFSSPEIAFLLPSGTATLGELSINPRNQVRAQRSVGELAELLTKRVVLAIGVSQGRIIDETNDSTRSQFSIRRAGEFVAVSEPVYRLWLWTLVPRSAEEFEAQAREMGGSESDPLAYARELEGLALIAEFGPDQSEWNELAERLRPIPLGFGVGNSEADLLGYEITDAAGRSRLKIHPLGFWIWLCWDGTTTIAHAANDLIPAMPAEVTRDVILGAAKELVLSCLILGLVMLDDVIP
jgi:hypothetical protein